MCRSAICRTCARIHSNVTSSQLRCSLHVILDGHLTLSKLSHVVFGFHSFFNTSLPLLQLLITSPMLPSSLRGEALLFESLIEGLDSSHYSISNSKSDSKGRVISRGQCSRGRRETRSGRRGSLIRNWGAGGRRGKEANSLVGTGNTQ